jgi:type VI secretion system Hcp family effector
MSEDIFVTITGSKQGAFRGLCMDPGFQGAMKLSSVAFGFSEPFNLGPVVGPSGQVTVSEIVITRKVDLVSGQILRALLTIEPLTTVRFSLRRSDPGELPTFIYLILTLTNALITDLQMKDDAGTGTDSVEEIHFMFEQCACDFKTIDSTGKVTGENKVGYNLVTRTPS